MSHGAFEGLLLVGMYYISDSMPHELGLATRIAPSLRSPIQLLSGVWDGSNLRGLKGEADGTLDVKIPSAIRDIPDNARIRRRPPMRAHGFQRTDVQA